jgi:hypothetical protein
MIKVLIIFNPFKSNLWFFFNSNNIFFSNLIIKNIKNKNNTNNHNNNISNIHYNINNNIFNINNNIKFA